MISTRGDVWKKTKAQVWVLENDSVYALQEKGETIFFLQIRKLDASTRWARPFNREMRLWFMWFMRLAGHLVQRGKTGWGSGRSFHGLPAL